MKVYQVKGDSCDYMQQSYYGERVYIDREKAMMELQEQKNYIDGMGPNSLTWLILELELVE